MKSDKLTIDKKKNLILIVIAVIVVLILLLFLFRFLFNRGILGKGNVNNDEKLSGVYISGEVMELSKNVIQSEACTSDGFLCVNNVEITHYDRTRGLIQLIIEYPDRSETNQNSGDEDNIFYPDSLSGVLKITFGMKEENQSFRSYQSILVPFQNLKRGEYIVTMQGYDGFDFTSDRVNHFTVSIAGDGASSSVYDSTNPNDFFSVKIS